MTSTVPASATGVGAGRGGGPLRVGLTGPMGAGKSTVAAALERRGAAVIDADELARRATDDPEVLERIAHELGRHLVIDGRLDRGATARLVFADDGARASLEAIVHPWVRAAAAAQEAALAALPVPPVMIVHDVPLLFESGLDGGMDANVLVDAPAQVRAARVAARGGDAAGVAARDAAQRPVAEKRSRADFLIANDGDETALEREVALLWASLRMLRS